MPKKDNTLFRLNAQPAFPAICSYSQNRLTLSHVQKICSIATAQDLKRLGALIRPGMGHWFRGFADSHPPVHPGIYRNDSGDEWPGGSGLSCSHLLNGAARHKGSFQQKRLSGWERSQNSVAYTLRLAYLCFFDLRI